MRSLIPPSTSPPQLISQAHQERQPSVHLSWVRGPGPIRGRGARENQAVDLVYFLPEDRIRVKHETLGLGLEVRQ